MVCAMHRLFQKAEDDRIMAGDFDPREERKKREAEQRPAKKPRGWLSRLGRRLAARRP